MRLFKSILLILIVLSGPISGALIFLDFKANQAVIAATQCENRDRPELACKGQCVLMQKLEKQSKEEEKEFPKTEIIVLFAAQISHEIHKVESFSKVQTLTVFSANYYKNPFILSDDKPPEVLS